MGSSSFYVFLSDFSINISVVICNEYADTASELKTGNVKIMIIREKKRYTQNFTVTSGSGLQNAGA